MSYFSHNLKFWRLQKGLSQEKFAAQLGTNRGKLSTYEESVEPRQEFLMSLVENFNVNLHYFFTRKMTENNFESFFLDFPDQDLPPERKRIGASIITKLLALPEIENLEERRRLTHEITVEITSMIEENSSMKDELFAFMRRLKV